MHFIRQGLGIALMGAALSAVPTQVNAATQDPSITQQMRQAASGKVSLTTSPATGRLSFARASDDLFPSVSTPHTAAGAREKASEYVGKYAAAFGATAAQLSTGSVRSTKAGYTVAFTQRYQSLPVFASRLLAHVDAQGDLTSVTGYVAPNINVPTTAKVDNATATAKAIRLTAAANKRHGALTATKSTLSVYRMGAIQGVTGKNLLAWVIEVTDAKQVRDTVVLDAITGKPVNHYSMIADALDRELHEESISTEPVWTEGAAFPGGLDADQQNEIKGTGEAYWLFKNSFGRDSYDGNGAKMITVNNDPSISCPNANWNGVSTNYCSGVSSDDTVAHEWGHAYTEHTSGLLYQWQPGAMNEAYSDIWGETVDMLNNRFNTPDEVTHRTDGHCSAGTRGDITFAVNSPAGSAGDCEVAPASFGPVISSPVTTDMVVGTDAVELDPDTSDPVGTNTDGCSAFDNASAIAGKFVYVDRGSCAFAVKIGHAEDAGATGIIFGNNRAGVSSVAGESALYGAMVGQADGARIKDAGTATLNITMGPVAGVVIDPSYRWLSGEDDPAFGGAIRDMWSPNCYGDPGKVSDEEYFCDTDDSGGVHTNSGVVNHTYALLVDGGTYNNVTVPAIGLDKAAHLFFRTQTEYLTPTSGYSELADGLTQSCVDLTGLTTLNNLSVGNSETGGSAVEASPMDPITAEDCAAVALVAQATELRTEPVQCNFQPMFKDHATIGCGGNTVNDTVWSEDFSAGAIPTGWTQDVEYAADGDTQIGHSHFDASVTNALPIVTDGGTAHSGEDHVLYFNDKGDAGHFGSCQGDEQDYSSRVGLATPTLAVPAGSLPRLSFDHYVASEVGWDGGNVKVSVNGGAFELVPDAAWIHNAPGGHLSTVGEGNTDPMAGETAFTGTDGGEPTGAWGNSVIDLSSLTEPGDAVKFRFDFGMDGCNGIDGWYIDNVALSACVVPVAPDAVRNLSATWEASTDTVTAMWEAPAFDGGANLSGYTVSVDGNLTRITGPNVTKATGLALAPGSHVIAVQALNSAGTSPTASTTVVVPAHPAPAPGTATVAPKATAKKGVITFTITTSNGAVPSGLVSVVIKGKTYTGTVVGTKLTIKAKALKKVHGKQVAKVSYPGDAGVAAFAAKVKVTFK